ncbi:MAG TPA: hypothetical protein VGO45_08750 [Bacteroidia bacterium]|jgi:hypothetical protein|nr:hypothetical protein [Bacteroidia bacterium]
MKLLAAIPALLVIIIIACYPGKLGRADKRHVTGVVSSSSDTTSVAVKRVAPGY